jgi:cytochrome oxidase Cu insertion factor (SCO1/SenC/PrrC family)
MLRGCAPREEAPKSEAKRQEAAAPPELVEADLPSRILGTIPDFQFTDQDGKPFGSRDLRGYVWAVNFIFTRCAGTCPVQTARLVELWDMLHEPAQGEGKTLRSDGVRFVSVTVDPEFDRPAVLRAYAEKEGCDPETWKFLTADRDTIWKFAKDGLHLPVAEDAKNEQMPILHDSKIALVDRMGRIRGYFDGTSREEIEKLNFAILFVLPEFQPPPDLKTKLGGVPAADTHLAAPNHLVDLGFLEQKRAAQLATVDRFDVFHDFRFDDRVEETGITFVPQIVDEQRQHLRVNHYDHGYGVSIADVDGDALSDIYFLNQVGGNELWRNRGGGKFENATERAGVAVDGRVSVAAAFGDLDNDGDADLYVTTVRDGNVLFLNDGKGNFADATAASGLGHKGHSSTPVLFDYDRDGRLDVFLTNVGAYTLDEQLEVTRDRPNTENDRVHKYWAGSKDAFSRHLKPQYAEESILFHNEGDNRFADVTGQVGLVDSSWSGDATPIDANGDGWLDLYLCNMQGHDQYYENLGGKRFGRKSREVFPKTPWGAMCAKVLDFDNDGAFDLYVTDMHSDMSVGDIEPALEKLKAEMQWPESFLESGGQSLFGNAFYKGDGRGGFREISDEIGAENYWPWGLTVADLNADGFEDAFLTSSMCFPYRYSCNSVLLNNGGREFLDAEFILGVEPRPDGRLISPWFELDASGKDKDHPLSRGHEGSIMVWSATGSRSSVIFDVDGDGDLDVVTNDFNTRPMVLVSNLSDAKKDLRWLEVALEGSKSNRDGLGAVVRVHAGGKVYMKAYDGKSGYLSQSLYPLYFGLGSARSVDRIEVAWPSGAMQTVAGPLEVNTRIAVRES